MKKFSILALSATVAIAPAFAETGVNYNTPSVDVQPAISFDVSQQPALPTTAQADLSFAFGDVENLQTTDMTLAEMQETEGAALPLAYMGGAALFGSMVNVNTYVRAVPQSQRTLGGYATAIGSGAVGGALTATPIGAMRAAFLGGGVALAGSGVSVTMKK